MLEFLVAECTKLGYSPRPVQQESIAWLTSVWNSNNKCKILSLPTGAGKSIVAKSISAYNESINKKTAIITPQNILIDQYASEFQDVNFLKGKAHYTCKTIKDTCELGTELAEESGIPCIKCPYAAAKYKCYSTDTTIFNPVSYYLLQKEQNTELGRTITYDVDTIIIDEVQSLSSFLRDLSTVKLWSHDIRWVPGITASIPEVVRLLTSYVRKLKMYIMQPNLDLKEKVRLVQAQRKIDFTIDHLITESKFFICEESEDKFKGVVTKCLLIRPKYVPPSIYQNFFKYAKHIVLMSGTAFPYMWDELGFKAVDYIDLPSPIAYTRRMIFAPSSITLSAKETDSLKRWDIVQELAQQIKRIVFSLHEKESGVILLPYNLAKELKSLLNEPCFIHMDKTTKKDKINQFLSGKAYGVGVFSGAYEGISLDNQISRFTIIPKVPYPNLMDKVVKARMTDNNLTYAMETMALVVQASGRSVRNEKDFGVCYILDSNFSRLYATTRQHLPKYFKESLVFSYPKDNHIKQLNQFRKEYNENDCNAGREPNKI